MIELKVLGHKNPDTDSVFSAILLAEYFNQKGYNAEALKLGELNNETKYLLEIFGEKEPKTVNKLEKGTKIAIVDHNEKTQCIDNVDELEIEFIVDHHRIDFSSEYPINIRMEKLCSTASIIYKMFLESNLEITTKIARLMLGAIISDSLIFKSPTTTKFDIEIAKDLQQIAGIENIEDFAMDMFKAKSDLGNISAEKIVKYDYKNFEINGKNLGIGTIETTNPNYVFSRKDNILEAMKNIKQNDRLDFILLSIVDIINEKNTSYVLDGEDSKIIEKCFNTKVENNQADLKRRLSRKKQIIPELESYFKLN